MREVVGVVGCGSDLIHCPVNPDCPSVVGQWLMFHLNDETRPPITDCVLIDPQLRRLRWQGTLPERRYDDTSGQVQSQEGLSLCHLFVVVDLVVGFVLLLKGESTFWCS